MKFQYRAVSTVLLLVLLAYLCMRLMQTFRKTDRTRKRNQLGRVLGTSTHPHVRLEKTTNSGTTATTRKNINAKNVDAFLSGEECQLAESDLPTNGLSTYDLFNKVVPQKPAALAQKTDVSDMNSTATGPKLTVLLVPHSHNDPGWLATASEYYVRYTRDILQNMVTKLEQYHDMTFIWAETVFLSMLWENHTDSLYRDRVRRLIHRGQLDIVNGGWVAPDEASTHYSAIIDQLIEGHQWLEKNLGVKPKVSWSPNPFGASSTMPYLLGRAGMQGMTISRIHSDVKAQLRQSQILEFHWSQLWGTNHNTDTSILCSVLPYRMYNTKYSCGPNPNTCAKFNFGRLPQDTFTEARTEPITDENVEAFSRELLNAFRQKSKHFRHNIILYPLGDDFRYFDPSEWDQQYKNYNKLFNYMKSRTDWNVEAKFGTLSEYFTLVKSAEALGEMTGESFPRLYGGFFPYMDHENKYWTGYFTTRPFLKQLAREVEGDLRSAEILNTLAVAYHQLVYDTKFNNMAKNFKMLTIARRNVALLQHHHAITGTSKSLVVLDYEKKLWKAKLLSKTVMETSAGYLLQKGQGQGKKTPKGQGQDPLTKEGQGQETKPKSEPQKSIFLDIDDGRSATNIQPRQKVVEVNKQGTKLVVFNPVAKNRLEIIRLKVNKPSVKVVDSQGVAVPCQSNPVMVGKGISLDNYELLFYANLAPLGMSVFTLTSDSDVSNVTRFEAQSESEIILENDRLRVSFSKNGLLQSIITKHDNITTNIALSFLVYNSGKGGAYVFEPRVAASNIDGFFKEDPHVFVIRGPLLSEVRVKYMNSILEHTVRLHHAGSGQPLERILEIENYVDLSGVKIGNAAIEIIMRLESGIPNGPIWYSDLNGFETVRHKRQSEAQIEASYQPMTTMAYIQGKASRLSILSAQSHGVASLKSGSLEVMLDRKIPFGDALGLGEGVLDNRRTISKFFLLLERYPSALPRLDEENKPSFPSLLSLAASDQLLNPVTKFVAKGKSQKIGNFHPLSSPMPCDVSMVNVRTLGDGTNGASVEAALILHRSGFQCGFKGDDVSESTGCSLTGGVLDDLALDFKVNDMSEMTLSLMYELNSSVNLIRLRQMEIGAFKMKFGRGVIP